MTCEECKMISDTLKASTKILLKAEEALELLWKGIDTEEECSVDNCPHTQDNEYYKKARKLCKELGIKGNYHYNGEYRGE